MFHSMIAPILALSFGEIAGLCRFTRAELTETLTSDYMLLARTKGLTRGQATVRHALKNAMDEIAGSISTITDAISEGAKGVNGAAESTQLLVVDMEKISSRMDKNAAIAKALQKETDIFTNF